MIIAYVGNKTLRPQEVTEENSSIIKEAVWLDLLCPSKMEESLIEGCLNIDIPTRQEMREIEFSSRLYKENGILFMTATMIAQSDSLDPKLDPVTFVLTPERLITIRYIEPQSFKLFALNLKKIDTTHHDAVSMLIELLDATVDRLADILEFVGARLDEYSKTIFRPETKTKPDYRQLMQQMGINGDLNTKARESLVTFNRLITFFNQTASTRIDAEGQLRLASLSKDIASLSDHANFVSNKVNFLLDATLGLVNIEQNNIIKIFSVAAVIFLPPTLIASIYGMNFEFMPAIMWKWGYVFSLILMALSSWLPYKYFKYKKWL